MQTPKHTGSLARIWNWMLQFDAAVHEHEGDRLRKEVQQLRSEVEKLRNSRFDQ